MQPLVGEKRHKKIAVGNLYVHQTWPDTVQLACALTGVIGSWRNMSRFDIISGEDHSVQRSSAASPMMGSMADATPTFAVEACGRVLVAVCVSHEIQEAPQRLSLRVDGTE